MVLRASVFVAFAVMLCTANCKVAFMLNFLQSRAANKTRLERDPTSFERDPGTPNTLTYPQIGQANQAKQSKPSSMCTRDHLQKQCSFPQIRATLKPKSKTLKMLCVLNTVYTYVYMFLIYLFIYWFIYSMLFIFFKQNQEVYIFDCFPPPERELEWLTLEFVPSQFLNLWRPGATSYIPCKFN